jgi:hypothetical protein
MVWVMATTAAPTLTVAALREILSTLSDDTPVIIAGFDRWLDVEAVMFLDINGNDIDGDPIAFDGRTVATVALSTGTDHDTRF